MNQWHPGCDAPFNFISMSNQQKVINILKELKAVKVPTCIVEKEIGVGSGYLWKVKEGIKPLNDDKLKLLVAIRDKKCNQKNPKIISVSKKVKAVYTPDIKIPVNKEISKCDNLKKSMPKGLSLMEQLDWREKHGG